MIDLDSLRLVKLNKRTKRTPCDDCGTAAVYETQPEGRADVTFLVDANDRTRAVAQWDTVGAEHVHKCDVDRLLTWAAADDTDTDTPAAPVTDTDSEGPKNVTAKTADDSATKALDALRTLLGPQSVDADTVRDMIKAELDGYVFPTRTVVERADGARREVEGLTHVVLSDVITAILAGENTYLVGPAGTGKSHMAEQVADALGLTYHGALSISAGTMDSDIMGFVVPGTGAYQYSPVTRAYEDGGVVVLDEIDKGHPGIISVINALTSNGSITLPDGRKVKRHADFRLIVTGNTYGNGPDRLYVGSCQLDAATLTRFAQIDVPIDPALEQGLCLGTGLDASRVDSVLAYVRALRANVDTHRLPIVLSPRTTVGMCRLLAAGMDWGKAHAMRVRSGITDVDWVKVSNGVKAPVK